MEGFATGFFISEATRPGFSIENEKFKVTFNGVMCNEVKNIVSHGFESCYDWRPVMELILEAASEKYTALIDIEERAENAMKQWLTSFRGWGLLASILPTLKHRYFIVSLAYTSANWDESTGGEHSEEKVFEAVRTVFDAVPGKEIASLVPKFGMWFEEMLHGGIKDQRKKNFTLFFNAKWVLEARFVVEKKRVVTSLVARAAESLVRRIETEQEIFNLHIPRTLHPVLIDKFRDAQWVRDFWKFKAELEDDRDENILDDTFEDFERLSFAEEPQDVSNDPVDVSNDVLLPSEHLGQGQVEPDIETEEDELMADKSDNQSFITASLWWAFYVLLVFFAYVCS